MSAVQSCVVDDFRRLTEEEFFARFVRPSVPVFVKGGLQLLGAIGTWTLDDIAERMRNVSARLLRGDEQVGYGGSSVPTEMVMDDLVALLEGWKPGDRAFLSRAAELLEPRLLDEIDASRFFPRDRLRAPSLRFGTGNTDSGLHFDPYENSSAELLGRKEWDLYAPSQHGRLSYFDHTNFRSRIDISNPDYEAFPAFRRARLTGRVVVEKGDLLFLPAYWWHRVCAREPCISLRLWYMPRSGWTLRKNHYRSRAWARWGTRVQGSRALIGPVLEAVAATLALVIPYETPDKPYGAG